MSKDYILHFQPEIPQIMVAQENKDHQIMILNVVKGRRAMTLMEELVGRSTYVNKG